MEVVSFMKEFIKQNWFKLSFAISVILIGFSVYYYFVFFLPSYKKGLADQQVLDKLNEQDAKTLESR